MTDRQRATGPDAPPATIAAADFENFFRAEFAATLRLAHLLGARDPEDVAQEAFVRLHTRWVGLREPSAAGGYLRTIVVNLVRTQRQHAAMAARRAPAAPPGDCRLCRIRRHGTGREHWTDRRADPHRAATPGGAGVAVLARPVRAADGRCHGGLGGISEIACVPGPFGAAGRVGRDGGSHMNDGDSPPWGRIRTSPARGAACRGRVGHAPRRRLGRLPAATTRRGLAPVVDVAAPGRGRPCGRTRRLAGGRIRERSGTSSTFRSLAPPARRRCRCRGDRRRHGTCHLSRPLRRRGKSFSGGLQLGNDDLGAGG